MKKYHEKIFNLLAEVLEENFPKGEKCECGRKLPCRSKALVLNAMADVYFRQFLEEFRKESYQDVRNKIKNIKTQCSYHGIACSPLCKECDIGIAKEEVKEELLKLLEE